MFMEKVVIRVILVQELYYGRPAGILCQENKCPQKNIFNNIDD